MNVTFNFEKSDVHVGVLWKACVNTRSLALLVEWVWSSLYGGTGYYLIGCGEGVSSGGIVFWMISRLG